MGFDKRYKGIDEYAVRIIKYKAKRLVGQKGFVESDREDLEQEILLDLLERLPKYNPNRAKRNTFIACIVDHKIATIIEARKAGLRDYRLCRCSLNERVKNDEGDSVERMEIFDQQDYLQRTDRGSYSEIEPNDASIDLGKEIEKLPSKLRELYHRLATDTITEISRDTGIPRSTIYDLITKLREILRDTDLRDYL